MTQTTLYKIENESERRVGIVEEDGAIYRVDPDTGKTRVGRAANGVVFRITTHDERELGRFDPEGNIHSHGLFEGGKLGWVDPDGVVVRAGLIFGEEEVGRVEGPARHEGAAALLLLFLPEDDEAARLTQRR